jgi:uncharacterized sporulation protein YeaH/YhbH (DUF444 family)
VDGRVEFAVTGRENEHIDTKVLEQAISDYKDDILASYRESMAEEMGPLWTKLAAKTSDEAAGHSPQIVQYAPHIAGAFREYLQVVELRLRKALEDAIKGKNPPKFGTNGVSIKVLGEIPQYQFVRGFRETRDSMKPVGPIDNIIRFIEPNFDLDSNGTIIGVGPHMPGDKFGEKPPEANDGKDGKGGKNGEPGKGKGKDKPKPGDPDDPQDPNPGHGNGSGDPTEIDIPLKLYGELLAELLDLPNIRRTKGGEAETQKIRRGSLRKPSGLLKWDETIVAAMSKARAIRKVKGLPYDASVPAMDLIREALLLVDPSDHVVAGRMEKELPDYEAVLVVNVDLTGSMFGERIEMAKNLVFNMKAMLAAKYKNVTIRYVGFDSVARELTEKQIFSQFFGGGTAYASAIKLDKAILEEYPNEKFNKYIVTIGDGETGDTAEYMKVLGEIKDDLQYAGLAITSQWADQPWGSGELIAAHKNLKAEWPWVGIATMGRMADIYKALKDLFPRDEQK